MRKLVAYGSVLFVALLAEPGLGDPAPSASAPSSAPAAAAAPSASWADAAETDRPDEAAWASAPALRLAREHRMCSAKRLREWVRVRCRRDPSAEEPYLGVRVVGGSHEDVRVSDPAEGKKGQRDIAVVFPARKGDRRVIELVGTKPMMWKSWTVYEKLELVISESWLPSETGPTITVH